MNRPRLSVLAFSLFALLLPLLASAAGNPVISGISPPTPANLIVTISGSNFESGAKVYVGGVAATAVWQGGSEFLVFQPPPNSRTGAVDVEVINPDGGSATLAKAFSYPSSAVVPVIRGVAPNSGPGNLNTVWGSNFESGAKVYLDGVMANSTWQVGTQYIVFAAPISSDTGAVDVKVVNPDGGTGTMTGAFAYAPPPPPVPVPTPTPTPTPPTGGGGGGTSSDPPFPRISALWIGGQQSNYDTEVSKLAKFDTLILNYWPGYRTSDGGTLEQTIEKIKAINPKTLVFVYTNDGELSNTNAGGAYGALWQKVSQMGWWAYNSGTSGIVLSDWGGGNFNKINNTTFTPPDSSGKDWVQWYAQWLKDNYYTPNPSIDGFMIDNVQWKPRVVADWNRDGTADSQTNPTVQQWYRQGYQQYYNTMFQILPGHYELGNSDCYNPTASCPEYNQLLNGSLMEGMLGYSWSIEQGAGWSGLMAAYRKAMGLLAAPQLGMFAQVGLATDYQSMRYGLASALMDNGYYIFDGGDGTDNSDGSYGDPPWFDEYDGGGHLGTGYLGQPLSGPSMTPYQNGVYRRDFQNGIVLVNPKGNGTQTVTLGGTYKKLTGTQAPNINNGASVTSVTLQDRDGLILLRTSAVATASTPTPSPVSTAPGTRNPLQWPFAQNSIWNMPVGSNATYHALGLNPSGNDVAKSGYFFEPEYLLTNPNAPQQPLMQNIYGGGNWSQSSNLCTASSKVLVSEVPIPTAFVQAAAVGYNEIKSNACAAIVMADGSTIVNTQQFARCSAGTPPVTGALYARPYNEQKDDSIKGDGRIGPHGGSYLSSLGGTIRVADIGQPIHHALKLVVSAGLLWRGGNWQGEVTTWDDSKAYIWPAFTADSGSASGYYGSDNRLKMGSLLAIPASVNLASLGFETVPGLIFAHALQDYGAYIVDTYPYNPSSPDSVFGISYEFGANASTGANQDAITAFTNLYGFNPVQSPWYSGGDARSRSGVAAAWVRDMDRIVSQLAVVTNNGPSSIGGGGTPLQPLAPPFQ